MMLCIQFEDFLKDRHLIFWKKNISRKKPFGDDFVMIIRETLTYRHSEYGLIPLFCKIFLNITSNITLNITSLSYTLNAAWIQPLGK